MFSQISSPVPFKLGDSNSPLSHVPGGFISASPMIRRMNKPRTANTPPHVNPLPRRNGVLGHLHVPSLTGSNVLPSLTMMDRLLKEGHDKVKEWQQWYIDSNPRSQFLKSCQIPESRERKMRIRGTRLMLPPLYTFFFFN